jgi:hypothetical protein
MTEFVIQTEEDEMQNQTIFDVMSEYFQQEGWPVQRFQDRPILVWALLVKMENGCVTL